VCFLFQARDDPVETFDIVAANATDNSALQCGQVTLNAEREFSPFCCWSD
jgi:hypothetical protein